jgi:colicin import membrane protein
MIDIFKKHPLAVILSVIFHLLLIGFFVFGMDFNDEKIHTKSPVSIVKATVIDESKIKAEADRLKKLERQKLSREKKRLADIKKKLLAEEKKIADLKKQTEFNKKKLAKQKADEAAWQVKLKKQQAIAKKKKADEAAWQVKLKKQQAAIAKKKKADALKKKKLAAAKKEKERIAKDKKHLADEKLRIAKEQADRVQALRVQAAQEEQQMRAEAAVASFTDLIRQKVERNWIQPPGDISGLDCIVRVRLIPGGDVVDAQVIKSSGNAFFDRSVELAARKAAPLPLPNDPNMFNYFRTLEFYFRPRG